VRVEASFSDGENRFAPGGAHARKLALAGSDGRFVWAAIADLYGIPGMPEWAEWFMGELRTHHALTPALGIGCRPVIINGEKEQFLDWLSWGVESGAIAFPVKSGPIHWPRLSLEDIFVDAV